MSGKEEMEMEKPIKYGSIEYEISRLARSMYGTIMNEHGFRKLIKGILEIAKKQNESVADDFECEHPAGCNLEGKCHYRSINDRT